MKYEMVSAVEAVKRVWEECGRPVSYVLTPEQEQTLRHIWGKIEIDESVAYIKQHYSL